MSRTLLRRAAFLVAAVAVIGCRDQSPDPLAPGALSRTHLPSPQLNADIKALITAVFPQGTAQSTTNAWDHVLTWLEAGNAAQAREKLYHAVGFVRTHTDKITPPAGETREQVALRLTNMMVTYAFAGTVIGSNATVAIVNPGTSIVVRSPDNRAAIDLPAGAFSQPTVLVLYRDPVQARAECAGPLVTTLCQYPLFYHAEPYPDSPLNVPARMGVCHVNSGPGAPPEGVDDRLRLAHDKPADPAGYVQGGTIREGIEILPYADVSDFLTCGTTTLASAIWRAPAGNSLPDRGLRVLGRLASAAITFVSPTIAHAIDRGGGGVLLDFSNFNIVDPGPPPDVSPPVVSPNVSGTLSSTGWYTSDVTITWNVTETGSTVTTPPCTSSLLSSDTPGQTFSCTATSTGGTTTTPVTIKRDASSPVITPTITGTPGANGWYTSNVSVAWAVTDATSGVGSEQGCANVAVTSDTDGVSFTCSAWDNAGNSSTKTVIVKRDAVRPVITAVVTSPAGNPNAAGWYTGNVGVSWSVTDATSDVNVGSEQGCGDVGVTQDTQGVTFTCFASDNAGNSATNSVTVKRDATPPVITAAVTSPKGSPNADGWYTGNVAVSWSVTDVTSDVNVGSEQGCGDVGVTQDTQGVTFTCSAVDKAGNSATRSVTVKRDATPPVITAGVIGPEGSAGWYTGNVGISWSVTDATSDVLVGSEQGCGDVGVTQDTHGVTFTCSAVDNAGNSGSKSVTVKRDATPPVITASVAGPEGTGGWYTGDVGVSWSMTDATSGMGSGEACASGAVTSDTKGVPFTCSASDNAGNTGTNSVTVKRDASPPVITAIVTGPEGNGGWYTGNVNVSWSVTDPTSGAGSCNPASVTSDTPGVTLSCSAVNGAGLSNSENVSVKRDATKPVIVYAGNAGSYTVDQALAITCTATDALSGLASDTCENITGEAYIFGLGTRSYSAAASDNAGNGNTASTSFVVRVTSTSLCTLTRRFSSSAGIGNSLCAKLGAYEASIARGSSVSAAGQVGAYINEVRAQSGKAIPSAKASTLISLAMGL